MATVLVFAWEIGAVAVLSRIIPRLLARGHSCIAAGPEPAYSCFRERCPERTLLEEKLTPELIDSADVCLAGYGSPARPEGLSPWEAIAEQLPTMAVLDQWKGLDRFVDGRGQLRRPAPDRIAAVSPAVAEALVRFGFPAGDVSVVGHAVLEGCADGSFPGGALSRESVRIGLGLPVDAKVYLLASEGVHDGHPGWGQCSGGCGKLFLADSEGLPLWERLVARDGGEDVLFVLRPHPRDPAFEHGGVVTIPWQRADDRTLLRIADRVYGISSMLFLQAAALGIETVCVRDMITDWQPSGAFLEEGVWDEMVQSGMLDHRHAPALTADRHAGAADRIVLGLESLIAEAKNGENHVR